MTDNISNIFKTGVFKESNYMMSVCLERFWNTFDVNN